MAYERLSIEQQEQNRKRLFFKKFVINNQTGCWEWIAGKNPAGYGTAGHWARKSTIKAHRLSWYIHKGDPGNLHVLHTCDNPACVNPNHLFLGTHQENMTDKKLKGRAAKPFKKICKWGHVKSDVGYYESNGGKQRICAECARIRGRKRYWEIVKK